MPIENVRRVVDYILKEATQGIGGSFAEASASMARYKALGGGRVVHSTRRFWRDHRRRPIQGGVRQARIIAMRSVPMWECVREIGSELDDVIASLEDPDESDEGSD